MSKKKCIYHFTILTALSLMIIFFAGCGSAGDETGSEDGTRSLRILATSDIHGKFYPYLYAQNREDTSGSLAQLAAAIPEYRINDTLLVDCGDSIQDNSADLFLEEKVHPVMEGLNRLGYDIWVTGNHDFNYGMDVTRKTIASFGGKVLVGNVYDEEGNPLGDGYTILDRNDVRVAVIGMVTPYIQFWDSANLEGYTVTDPVEESRKIIAEIRGQYDVLVGAMHMDLVNDNEYPHSGVEELAQECPEFDVIIASHGHDLIEGERINGVLVVENLDQAKTMSVIDLTLRQSEDGWSVSEAESQSVDISQYQPDPDFLEAFRPYHEEAVRDALTVIGTFDGDSLVEENEIDEVPRVLVEDSALIDLINSVMMYYGEADVSSTTTKGLEANMHRGDIRKCDMSLIYRFSNTLYTFRMTGSQLKTFMEWSASYYNQYRPGDLTISFDKDNSFYSYHMLSGVNYEIDISRGKGDRIRNMTWPDGRPVQDDDTFIFAVDNFCASSHFMAPGTIFSEGDMPELIQSDVRPDIGSIPDMIRDYIVRECGGVLKPECDHNWKLTGNDWDEDFHRQVVELVREGKLKVTCSNDADRIAVEPVREEDLKSK